MKNTYISIAATVLLLIGIAFLIMRPPSIRRLGRKYYEAPMAQIHRPNAPPEDSLFEQGMIAYGRKKWADAISIFNQIDEAHPQHQRILYYMAHAFVAEGQYDKALALFNNPVFYQGQYREQAEWFKVIMAMLLNHPQQEIIDALKAISVDTHQFYSDKAKEILKRMKVK